MTSSFLAASARVPAVAPSGSDFDSQGFGQNTSPPSLTTASSPASSESTGDDQQQFKVATSGQTGRPQQQQQQLSSLQTHPSSQTTTRQTGKGTFGLGAVSVTESGFSPSIWTNETPSNLFKGIQDHDQDHAGSDIFATDKNAFDSINFGDWDSSFSSSGMSLGQDEDISMDMESAATFSPLSAQSPETIANIQQKALLNSHSMAAALAAASIGSPACSDVKTGIYHAFHRNGQQPAAASTSTSTYGSEHNFAGSGDDSDGGNAWMGETSDNDEAMFESLIQAESFGPPSATASNSGSHTGPANGQPPASAAVETSVSQEQASNDAAQQKALKPEPTEFSSSQSAPWRQSGDASTLKSEAGPSTSHTPATGGAKRYGCQTAVHSNNLDADLGYSAFTVIRPPREQLKDLQVHVHGVPMHGAKSRVETQIRMRLELVQPKPMTHADGSRAEPSWDRVGSFTHIKLPPLTGTKRKSKKYQCADVPPEKTLFVDATVVNASPPHDRVFVCKGCRQRERKRAHRKKDLKAPVELQQPSAEEMKSLGIDPSAPDAGEKAAARMEEEEKKRVVLFNCGDYVDFEEGEAVLPTRITCYCRHHKEKVGFCVIFTMRDWQGRLVATGSTPPIMITDDHKSMGISSQAAAAAAAAAQQSQQPQQAKHQPHGVVKQVSGASPRAPTTPGDDGRSPVNGVASGATTPNGGDGNAANGDGAQRRKDRAKPYAADSRRRRNTSGKKLSMTPYSGTGQNTPAAGMSPPPGPDMGSTDFWSAFALAGASGGSNLGRSNSGSTSAGAAAPGGAALFRRSVSPAPCSVPAQSANNAILAQQMQQQQQHQNQQQARLAQMPQMLQTHMEQGSLSPTTLQINMQSLPQFDFEQFFRNAQTGMGMGMSNGTEFAQFMAMAAAAALPAQTWAGPMAMPLPLAPNSRGPAMSPAEQRSLPRISKLIPGEGPTSGGIEVTVLGENFVEGISCIFGDVAASNTKVWASNTLVCVLPPSPSPGPVVVSLKGAPEIIRMGAQIETSPLQLFTYVETTDRALMELALQVVGLQMTGQMRSAREVAMRVVGSGQQLAASAQQYGGTGNGHTTHAAAHAAADHSQSRDAVDGLFAAGVGRRENSNFQNTVVEFLSILDEPLDRAHLPADCTPRPDAIRLANRQGHTLLHLAIMMGFHRLVEFVILRGCPVNTRDTNGATALHFAALLGRVTITRLLLRHGAQDGIADANGLLPIDLACEEDQVDVEMILADTDRTGHWVPAAPAVASHYDSGISISDYGVDHSDDDDSEGEDERGLDSDNLSTNLDEESEAQGSFSDGSTADEHDEEEEASSAASDSEGGASNDRELEADTTTPADRKAAHRATDEKRAVAIEIEDPLPALKSWLARAGDTVSGVDWVNKNLLSRPVSHRFAQLQMPAMPTMPAIPVFHLAFPAAPSMPLMPWSSRSSDSDGQANAEGSGSSDRKAKGKAADTTTDSAEHWETEERGRLLRMWRSVVEESALWINPLYSPPPAYESVADGAAATSAGGILDGSHISDSDDSSTAGPSSHAHARFVGRSAAEDAETEGSTSRRVPSSGAASSRFEAHSGDVCNSGSSTPRASGKGAKAGAASGATTPIGRPKLAAGQRASSAASGRLQATSDAAATSGSDAPVSTSSTTATAPSASRRKRTLRDDAMLVWFWIPVLLAVCVVLCFSKSSSVLSLADLMSYIDLPLDYYRPQATVQAAQEGIESAAARIEEIGRNAL